MTSPGANRPAGLAPISAPEPDVPAEIERHYSLTSLAELTEISVPSWRRFEREGRIRGVRIAGRLRFPESAVREFLASCANAPRRTPPAELLAAGGRPRGRRRR